MHNTFSEKYKELRKQVDMDCARFETMHKNKMQCKKGCYSCCESLSIFPIEMDAIAMAVENREDLPKRKFKHKYGKACRFLVNGACSIYENRPIICRTQGLPLLYENSRGTGYELSVCTLNFVGVDVTKLNIDNALFMPPINSKLFLLNKEYVENLPHKKLKTTHRIKLNSL